MLYKQLFVFDKKTKKPKNAIVRNYTTEDFDELLSVQKEAFPPPFPSELWWNVKQIQNHVAYFPDGALCIEMDGKIVGSMTGLIVDIEDDREEHTWEQITDNGYIRNHNNEGNTLYVVDICVSPSYRSYGLGQVLMQSMYEVVIHMQLDRLLGGGRMPNYHKYAHVYSPQQFVEGVVEGHIYDPVITFLLKSGRTPVHPVKDYLEDEESLNYGLLMEWKNPFKR
ncbi:ribosomal protein S18 acetylase RimI-like enzyme [Salirhabdus euzebyi]|uniref:Ribosomal protein S18 acetylase RimI-like enzyme n=1 Tax=Salirhabdus euzebyi TaxID=394506 RepID=A0A841PYU8_9BACI|nr:GNAT family N-acetyltransferase [Salirhabdus euzebyi]MBB6452291.1 ribosomal protein S18 acetylase RimI-like enzyme [Salirhabdus euzebyi]